MKFLLIFVFLLLQALAIQASAFEFALEKKPMLSPLINFKASELCAVAENSRQYLNKNKVDEFAVHGGSVFESDFKLQDIKDSLAFICKTYREDVRAKRKSRLHDIRFIEQNFNFYRWYPDTETARSLANKSSNEVKSRLLNSIPEDKIFLTKYYTKLLNASAVKTKEFNQALYALPIDEGGLSAEQVISIHNENPNKFTRFKYTRQEVIAGVLDNQSLAKPLIWLSEEALHDVLLQGTGVVEVEGKQRYFNVHRNNGIAYDYTLGKREQARYWYFIEVPSIMGYGSKQENKVAIKPQVTFAGNVRQLGLGKLFLVSYSSDNKEMSRMGVLADQGGAFDNNLFQLDMLVDSYYGWEDYYQANKNLPDYAKAWLLLLK
jgi:hypothetical protein